VDSGSLSLPFLSQPDSSPNSGFHIVEPASLANQDRSPVVEPPGQVFLSVPMDVDLKMAIIGFMLVSR
jgi:hypothetical protein